VAKEEHTLRARRSSPLLSVEYFLSAVGAHLSARGSWFSGGINWSVFLPLAVTALAAGLACHGPA
jgi:hypothetical protein